MFLDPEPPHRVDGMQASQLCDQVPIETPAQPRLQASVPGPVPLLAVGGFFRPLS